MELYNKKFVYFEWDKILEDKKGFVAQDIASLRRQVKDNPEAMVTLSSSGDDVCPFTYYDDGEITCDYQFAYYDPYYEFRKAYLEGKQLQFKNHNGDWEDVLEGFAPLFTTDEYRIKPETTWYIVLDDYGLSRTNSKNDRYVVFKGTEDECIKWYDNYKSFEKIMLAWKQGKTIQYKEGDEWIDWHLIEIPRASAFDKWKEWRIKDEVEYVPFNSVQELIDAWKKKSGLEFNHELLMPLIWIKNKECNSVHLIIDFFFERDYYDCDVGTGYENLKLKELFDNFTFLDGSIIGKKEEILR